MKNLKFTLAFIFTVCLLSLSYSQTTSYKAPVSKGHQLYKQIKNYDRNLSKSNGKIPRIQDRAEDRSFYELDRTCDPKTRKIPTNIKTKEEAFSKEKKTLSFKSESNAKSSGNQWRDRGPFNVGGRTRALAIDLSNERVILAGGVSGGMWRSEDEGQSWRKATRGFQAPSVTTIAQDPRPGYQYIWYYGSGERFGNSASANGAFFLGSGVYKSQDGGRTWELLRATADNNIVQASPFDIINKIIVDPTNGDVYVASRNGIHKSSDGGNSFKQVLIGNQNDWTTIDVTSTGVLYAAIDTDITDPVGNQIPNSVTGIFTSTDGENWINISREENVFDERFANRTVFGINPSNENEVYIFTNRRLSNGNLSNTFGSLYRFTANQPKKWEDLSNNLPNARNGFRMPVGSLNMQSGYNMLIKVHPVNPNLVIIGGTNLYRSFDGFRTPVTPNQNNWIGGYSPRNDISLYPQQHPDQHELLFFPSNPNKVLSANDGGVFVTEDITTSLSNEEPILWNSLNNGYLTTQPYAFSFDPQASNDNLLAGFQDNGSWFTNQTNSNASWIEEFSGDGSYNAIADKGKTRYSSSQNGNIFRINYDEAGNQISFARVTPNVGGNFSFINPFILDPINDNVMFLPMGRSLLFNSNLDELPINTNQRPTKNWARLPQATVESIQDRGRELNIISALDLSQYPEADKLYYGTGQGQIFRIDYVSTATTRPIDIHTNKGLPSGGYISSINVDPANSDRVVISFSNYNIPSIFYTEDAGNTWIDISGNLEENRDGTGNGPSVRSVSFLGNNDGIFAATSTGLYFTNRLEGKHTVWRLNSREIGNSVIEQVKSRKDGFTAVAVHGNGLYSKRFNVKPLPERTLTVVKARDEIRFPTTTRSTTIDTEGMFIESTGAPISLSIDNSNPDFLSTTVEGNKIIVTFNRFDLPIPEYEKEGVGRLRIIAESNGQKIASGLRINTFQEPFFTRHDPDKPFFDFGIESVLSRRNIGVNTNPNQFIQSGDNMIVPDGEKWNIERILALGLNRNESQDPSPKAKVIIYKEDASGKAGEILTETEEFDIRNFEDIGDMDLVLPSPIELNSGRYWISTVKVVASVFGGDDWIPLLQSQESDDSSADAHFRDQVGAYFPGAEWLRYGGNIFVEEVENKLAYQLYGTKQQEGNKLSNTIAKQNSNDIIIFPNPSASKFTFKFNDVSKKATISISDISGKLILNENHSGQTDTFIWDAGNMPSGIYFVTITGSSSIQNSKLILK